MIRRSFYVVFAKDIPCVFSPSAELELELVRGGRKSDDATAGLAAGVTVVMEVALESPPAAKTVQVLVLLMEVSAVAAGVFGNGGEDCGRKTSSGAGGP